MLRLDVRIMADTLCSRWSRSKEDTTCFQRSYEVFVYGARAPWYNTFPASDDRLVLWTASRPYTAIVRALLHNPFAIASLLYSLLLVRPRYKASSRLHSERCHPSPGRSANPSHIKYTNNKYKNAILLCLMYP